jgi:hypothetical protein
VSQRNIGYSTPRWRLKKSITVFQVGVNGVVFVALQSAVETERIVAPLQSASLGTVTLIGNLRAK